MKRILSGAVALFAILAMTSTVSMAATPGSASTAARDERDIRSAIIEARTDLARHHRTAALSSTGNAETMLLNAMQAKIYSSPSSLTSLEHAHDDLESNRLKQAALQLRLAQSDLLPLARLPTHDVTLGKR